MASAESGTENKTEKRRSSSSRVSPIDSYFITTDSHFTSSENEHVEGSDAEAEDAHVGERLRKYVNVCLTDTEGIEKLLRDYMIDFEKSAGNPWQLDRGTVVQFAQAATESVTGDPVAVSFQLGRYYEPGGRQWRLELQIQMPTYFLPAYVSADRDATTWVDYLHTPTGATNKAKMPQMRALIRFLRDIFTRAAVPSVSEHKDTENVTFETLPFQPNAFEFRAPRGRIASEDAIRVFARIVAAVAYTFASIVTIEPAENHSVGEKQTEEAYLSPIPTHIKRLRFAFPTLPIRVLYRRTGQGLVITPRPGGYANPRIWPTLSVSEAVHIATTEGATDVAAVRLM
jgi:hypothetical protein